MIALPLRLAPGDDLRRALERAVAAQSMSAAFVLSGIGSLSSTQLRWAGAEQPTAFDGDVEIVSLAGSLSPSASHLHMVVSDAQGRVFGGHAGYGCIVRTTAEVLLALLPDSRFAREHDAATGFAELAIHPLPPSTR